LGSAGLLLGETIAAAGAIRSRPWTSANRTYMELRSAVRSCSEQPEENLQRGPDGSMAKVRGAW